MQETYPGRANVLYAPQVAKATGAGITSDTATVTGYLVVLDGDNAGKWWDAAGEAWSATEASAGAMTHKAKGNWYVSIVAGAWTEDNRYWFYAAESGDLNIPGGEQVVCKVPPTGAGAYTDTITVKDHELAVVDGAEVWITNDVDGVDGSTTVAGTKVTDANGQVSFSLDAGYYWAHAQKGGLDFSTTYPQRFQVTSDGFSETS